MARTRRILRLNDVLSEFCMPLRPRAAHPGALWPLIRYVLRPLLFSLAHIAAVPARNVRAPRAPPPFLQISSPFIVFFSFFFWRCTLAARNIVGSVFSGFHRCWIAHLLLRAARIIAAPLLAKRRQILTIYSSTILLSDRELKLTRSNCSFAKFLRDLEEMEFYPSSAEINDRDTAIKIKS